MPMLRQIYVNFCIRSHTPREELWWALARFLETWGVRNNRWQYFVNEDNEDVELEDADWEQIIHWHSKHMQSDFFSVLLAWPGTDWECCLWCKRHEENQQLWAVTLDFREGLVLELGYPFCDQVMQIAKEFFQDFGGLFSVAGHERELGDYVSQAYTMLLNEGLVSPKIFEDVKKQAMKAYYGLKEEEVWQHLEERVGIRPIWFFLVDKDLYEASKPYLLELPFKRIEDLPNGGALLFVDYPYVFEKWDDPQPQ